MDTHEQFELCVCSRDNVCAVYFTLVKTGPTFVKSLNEPHLFWKGELGATKTTVWMRYRHEKKPSEAKQKAEDRQRPRLISCCN